MMRFSVVLALAVSAVCAAGCSQPALFSCLDDAPFCGGRCCGTSEACLADACVPTQSLTPCSVGNGGCSADALCDDTSGAPRCACRPGFRGDGLACAACAPCAANQYVVAPCFGPNDTVCGDCPPVCGACVGPTTCTACVPGFTLMAGGVCVPGMSMMFVCGNGLVEPGEQCDDTNLLDGDGCSHLCQVEPNHYCIGGMPSVCQPGGCLFDPLTSLPLNGAFALDGAGTPSTAGLLLTQRSTIHTTADVEYPVVIEADVLYGGGGADVTFAGTRGTGLRDAMASNEPAGSLWARLSTTVPFPMELAIDTGTVIANTSALFAPAIGIPYRVRFVDDGYLARVEWFNLVNPSQGEVLPVATSFHGGADRAFIGGGDMGAVTARNLRVCSAPRLPVTFGLAARYSAQRSWTVTRDNTQAVSVWQDLSGKGRDLSLDGNAPAFAAGLLGGKSALDFGGGARLSTAAFPLTTSVTVFAVVQPRTPAQSGAIAHHGDRDTDWSLEQDGSVDLTSFHFQSVTDATHVALALSPTTTYVLSGRINGGTRSMTATALPTGVTTSASFVDGAPTITAGSKVLWVGASSAGDASNAAIGELVYYDRALSDGERDAVIAYLRAIWKP